jgi:hypothetical protein
LWILLSWPVGLDALTGPAMQSTTVTFVALCVNAGGFCSITFDQKIIERGSRGGAGWPADDIWPPGFAPMN